MKITHEFSFQLTKYRAGRQLRAVRFLQILILGRG